MPGGRLRPPPSRRPCRALVAAPASRRARARARSLAATWKMDDALLLRSVESLLDDDDEASAAPPEVPSGGTSSASAAPMAPNPMVAIASAMLEAQGPRPSFGDFATVPSQNPFAAREHVFVTRHGARIDNGPDADAQWLAKAGHGRPDDPHLSPSGLVAAAELAARLAASEVRVAHVVTSPYLRCVQTANAVAERLGVAIKLEPGISEVGAFAHTLLTTAELASSFPRVDTSYVPAVELSELKPEHSDAAAAHRAHDAALAVRERLDGPILYVGHGASCLGLVQAFGGSGYVGYTSVSHFTRDLDGTGQWVLDGALGEVSHLSDQRTALGSAW